MSLTFSPRYSVSSAATASFRYPLMASTSATLLAFGTASPRFDPTRPQRASAAKTDGPLTVRCELARDARVTRWSDSVGLAYAGALGGLSCHAATGRSLAHPRVATPRSPGKRPRAPAGWAPAHPPGGPPRTRRAARPSRGVDNREQAIRRARSIRVALR